MSAKINADSGIIRQVATDLRLIAEDMRASWRNLRDAQTETAEAWKSTYTEQFLGHVYDTGERVRVAQSDIQILAGKLFDIAVAIERAEEENRKLFRNS